ncbi:MAG: BTAD domain-containing putative transcriptional regulator [Gaiellaceae bacterium]
MEYRILGPLEVVVEGRTLPLASKKQRALLAVLLLRAGQVVSRDRLIDALWEESPPASGVAALRVHISELRKLLDQDDDGRGSKTRLQTVDPGYRLDIAGDLFDLKTFETLVEDGGKALGEGQIEAASEALGDAVSLWRGPALADFTYDGFAQQAIGRLAELRLVALERQVEAELALGRHADVIPELEQLVSAHPLRERLRGQLMLALYQADRQADALATYRDGRRVMSDELGIEPGYALQELEQSILRQDRSLTPAGRVTPAPSATPAQEPAIEERDRSLLVALASDANLDSMLSIAEPLATRPPGELVLVRLVHHADELGPATDVIHSRCEDLEQRGTPARGMAFVSTSPGADVTQLARHQDADLVLFGVATEQLEQPDLDTSLEAVLGAAPCDVALVATREGSVPTPDRVLVPMGGAEHEWAAVEVGAWLASALDAPFVLLGVEGREADAGDASRLLGHASLAVQRVLRVAAKPQLIAPGDDAVVEAAGESGVVVMGLSDRWHRDGLGATRLGVATKTRAPALIVRHGLRPGGLAPRGSLTRFTWALSGRFG